MRNSWAPRIQALHGLAVDLDAAGQRRHHPGDHLGQLELAIARHPGDPQDLAFMHRQGEILEAAALAAGGRDGLQPQQHPAGPARRPRRRRQLAPAHELGEAVLGDLGVIGDLGHAAALAHDHDPLVMRAPPGACG
jgi:hypothetical protein